MLLLSLKCNFHLQICTGTFRCALFVQALLTIAYLRYVFWNAFDSFFLTSSFPFEPNWFICAVFCICIWSCFFLASVHAWTFYKSLEKDEAVFNEYLVAQVIISCSNLLDNARFLLSLSTFYILDTCLQPLIWNDLSFICSII